MKAFLYTLVLGTVILISIILMQRFDVSKTARIAHPERPQSEPIASTAPVDMAHLDTEALQKYSLSELYQSGVEFLEQWHVPEARAVFLNVIKQDSSFAAAYLRLAECNADPLLFNESRIARCLEGAHRIDPGDTLIIAAMKNLYLEADYAGAADKLRAAVRSDESDLGNRYLLAQACFSEGRLREAQTALEAILERDESHGRARALLVECLDGQGKPDDAELLARDLARLYPGEPYPYVLLARVQMRSGNTGEAVEFCNNALNMDHRFGPAIVTRGDLYMAAGQYEAARVTFEKLLLFDSPEVAAVAWESIACIDFLSGNFDGAVEGMDESIRLAHGAGSNLRAAATLYRLVNYLCELGQGNTARTVLAKWISTTGVVPAQFGRLRLDIFFGDLSGAAAALAEIDAAASRRRLMDLLGIDRDELVALTLLKERKYDRAIELLTGGRESDTRFYLLGFASFQSGYAEQASTYFTSALRHGPQMSFPYHGDPVLAVQSLFYLAETSIAVGKADEARSYYQRFLDRWGGASWDLQAVERARDKLETLAAASE